MKKHLIHPSFSKGIAWLFSSWYLLGWILFNPAAWRNYLKSIDSNLQPDCTLWEMWGHWRKPEAQTLRLSYILLPVMMALLVSLVHLSVNDTDFYNAAVSENTQSECEFLRKEENKAKLFGDSQGQPPSLGRTVLELCLYSDKDSWTSLYSKEDSKSHILWSYISYAWTVSCLGALFGGFLVSTMFGLITANVAAFLLGISGFLPVPFQNLVGILVGFVAGSMGASAISIMFRAVPLKQRINYFSAIFMIMSIVTILMIYLMQANYASLLLLIVVFIYAYGKRNGLIILFIYLLISAILDSDLFQIRSFNIVAHYLPDKDYAVLSSTIDGIFLTLTIFTTFGISYGIGKKLLDTWSGSVVGITPAMIMFILHYYEFINLEILNMFLDGNLIEDSLSPEWRYYYDILKDYYLFIILFTVLLSYHNYILRYIVESAVGVLLYHTDKKRYENVKFPLKTHYLSWHPAFYDKTQTLPFYELEDYLILIGHSDPKIVQPYISKLRETHQTTVVKNTLVFFEILKLSQLKTITDIETCHLHLPDIDNYWLNIFKEISKELFFALRYASLGYVTHTLEQIETKLNQLEKSAWSKDDKLRDHILQVVTCWSNLIKNDEMIQRLTAHRHITNPYVPSRPLHPEDRDLFHDRREILSKIGAFIEGNEVTLTLYGKKEIGKTSILLNLHRLIQKTDTMVFFYINLQVIGTNTDERYFWINISQEIKRGSHLEIPELHATADNDYGFYQWFDQLIEQLATKTTKVILCFDELGILFENFRRGALDENILEIFRALGHRYRQPQVKFIFAYPTAVCNIPTAYRLFTKELHLSQHFDNDPDARKLIEHPIEGFELSYESAVVDRILKLTARHPRLMQRICYELVEYKNKQNDKKVILEDLEKILPEVTQSFKGLFSTYFNEYLSEEEQKLFGVIAAHPAGVNTEQLLQQWKNLAQLNQLLEKLIEVELIVERSSQSNDSIYQVTIELLGEWTQTQSSI